MANVIVTLKARLETPDTDVKVVKGQMHDEIEDFGGRSARFEVEPIAFGLKAINVVFVLDEEKGNLDPLEDRIRDIDGVSSVEIEDMRRAIG